MKFGSDLPYPMQKHDEEEDSEEVVRVVEYLILRPSDLVGRRRKYNEHRIRDHSPRQVGRTLKSSKIQERK